MRTISGSNLNVVVYETVPHLLVTAWYPVACQEIYLNRRPFLVSRNRRQDTMHSTVTPLVGRGHGTIAHRVAITGNAVVPDLAR
jgi:hypothetical protein